MLVFNLNTKIQLSVLQNRRYRLSNFGQIEWDFDRDPCPNFAGSMTSILKSVAFTAALIKHDCSVTRNSNNF